MVKTSLSNNFKISYEEMILGADAMIARDLVWWVARSVELGA